MRTAGSIGLAAVALLLAGCMTAAERRTADEDKCSSYGFHPKTDAFAECLQRIDLARQARLNDDSYRSYGPWDGPVIVYRPMMAPRPHS